MNRLIKLLTQALGDENIKRDFANIEKGPKRSVRFNSLLIDKDPAEWVSKDLLLSVWRVVVKSDFTTEQIREALALIDRVINMIYTNENSRFKIFVDFRRPLKGTEYYNASLELLGDPQRSKERKQEYKQKVLDKALNRERQPEVTVEQVFEAIDKTSESRDIYDSVIAVMLASGARLIEVLRIGSFKASGDKLVIDEVAKKRSTKFDIIRPVNRISAQDVVKLIAKIRTVLDTGGSNEELTKRYNNQVNRRVDKLFPGHDFTGHSLRYLAGMTAYYTYGGGSAENAFLQKYLGHEDANVSRVYQSINMPRPADPKPVVVKQKKRLKTIQAVDFPDLVNPSQRTTKQAKFELLDEIFKRYEAMGVKPTQAGLKTFYNFGSAILGDYWTSLASP